MNLYDLNNDNTIINIDGKDIEMKQPICWSKVYDKWLVSKCGKIWSLKYNRILKSSGCHGGYKQYCLLVDEEDWWGDGSGVVCTTDRTWKRQIKGHKIVMDTWAPLYDNPPKGIVWEEWEIVRDLPTVYDHISKTVVIDHIDDDPQNNHIDNLRRVTQWDNNHTRKSKGI